MGEDRRERKIEITTLDCFDVHFADVIIASQCVVFTYKGIKCIYFQILT